MAISPLTIIDTFSRSGSTLGTTDSGQAWTTQSTSVTNGGGYSQIRAFANEARRFSRLTVPVVQAESSVLMKFLYTGTAAYPLTDFGPLLSLTTTNTGYGFSVQGNYSEVSIFTLVNNTRYEMSRKSISLAKDTWYWVRFQRTLTGLRAKIWAETVAEPSSWFISSILFDGANPPRTGHTGFYVQGTRDQYDVRISNFYFYSDTEVTPTTLAADTFDGRTVSSGWGRSTSGHIWEGAVADDPEYFALDGKGSVATNRATLTLVDTVKHYAMIGPVRSADDETYVELDVVANYGNVGTTLVGIRGTAQRVSNRMEPIGYAAQLDTGSNTIKIIKRTVATDAWTVLDTSAAGVTVDASTVWCIRVQIIGTLIRARYWAIGVTEPTSWQVTASDSAITQGRMWLGMWQDTPTFRNVRINAIESRNALQDSGTVENFTTTASLTITNATDDTITLIAYYVGDADENNSLGIRYKKSTDTLWSTWLGGYLTNRSLKFHSIAIAGLQPATNYNVEVTYIDPLGVQGPNPLMISQGTSEQGVAPLSMSVTAVSTSTIAVAAVYDRDTDQDSSAILETRKTSNDQRVVQDYFTDELNGVYLQNTESIFGGEWTKHSSMTPSVNAIKYGPDFYVNTVSTTDKVLYYQTSTIPIAEYTVEAQFHGNALVGQSGLAARVAIGGETFYGFGINSSTSKWELFKKVSGVKTSLAIAPFSGDLDRVYTLKLVVMNAVKYAYLDGTLIMSSADNAISDSGRVGYYATDIPNGTPLNQFSLRSFVTTYRTTVASWVSHGAMTVNRTTKTFTKTATGLDQDSVYECRVTFSDPDNSSSPTLLITAMTTGSALYLSAVGATVSPTAAIVDVFYDFDTNNNSTMELQYKPTLEYMWTTIPFSKIKADRTIKKFSTTLGGLRASTTYEVKVIVSDPDGLMQTSPSTLSGLFTTEGFAAEDQTSRKHYMWKVYDRKGVYIGTLPDPPEPEFSIHENGGVTDLQFTLARSMAESTTAKIIDFQNIVDIWAIDPSSNGMGPNLITDADADPTVGAWVVSGAEYGQNSDYRTDGGPDDSSCIEITADSNQYETSSNPIENVENIPLVISMTARAKGAKLRTYARAYDNNDIAIDSSTEIAETVGDQWQRLTFEYTPPMGTSYIRVLLRNTGHGQMRADKFSVLAKETLVYRGRIEAYTPKIDENGETVDIEVLGLSSLLSDDYIDFLQFVEAQPTKDLEAQRINYGAKDPADMLKFIVDEARRVNPMFALYYTTESIRYTGNLMQYTFKDQQIRAAMDKIRTLCPSGWHYYIEPDGLVVLRGPEHATTHVLRLGVEVLRFEVEKSIRNLKNYIRVKGRQDEDQTEVDGFGSINYIAFDQKSIDEYGKRTLFVRDAQLVDPESAKIVGDGRLDESNREEQRARCFVPDEKGEMVTHGSLKGYNIESFRAGDNVIIIDPIAGPRNTFWDQFNWDEAMWDVADVFKPLVDAVPIKTIQVHGTHVELELSERPPSSVGDFSKLYRWLANKDRED